MEKKTKVMVAVAVMALVIGVVIYFYTKKKKEDAALRMIKSDPRATAKYAGAKVSVKPRATADSIGKPAEAILAPES